MQSEPSPQTAGPGSDRETPGSSTWSRLAWAALALLAVVLGVRAGGAELPAWISWIQSLGAWGPAAFIALYAVAAVLFVPGSILTLAGGAIFGVTLGTIYVFIAAVIGSSLAFLIARYAARGWVERRLRQNPRFDVVDRAVGENGLKITFLLRLSPVFPFNLMNYALGLTRVSFRDYLLASFGMLPATILYVYSGRVIGDVAVLASGGAAERGIGYYAVMGVGLLAALAAALLVGRVARRALGEVAQA
ncbi:MAG: TVP38/TMEM64 family protein [Myxococcota bacterium]